MESVIVQILYGTVALCVALSFILFGVRRLANGYHYWGNDTYFTLGVFSFVLGVLWPVSIFGLLSVWLGVRARKQVEKRRTIQNELSKG